jgi:hypothetical protein
MGAKAYRQRRSRALCVQVRIPCHTGGNVPLCPGIDSENHRLFIPFSKQALYLDEDGGWTIGGVRIKTWSDLGSRPAQKWIIDLSMYHLPQLPNPGTAATESLCRYYVWGAC